MFKRSTDTAYVHLRMVKRQNGQMTFRYSHVHHSDDRENGQATFRYTLCPPKWTSDLQMQPVSIKVMTDRMARRPSDAACVHQSDDKTEWSGDLQIQPLSTKVGKRPSDTVYFHQSDNKQNG